LTKYKAVDNSIIRILDFAHIARANKISNKFN